MHTHTYVHGRVPLVSKVLPFSRFVFTSNSATLYKRERERDRDLRGTTVFWKIMNHTHCTHTHTHTHTLPHKRSRALGNWNWSVQNFTPKNTHTGTHTCTRTYKRGESANQPLPTACQPPSANVGDLGRKLLESRRWFFLSGGSCHSSFRVRYGSPAIKFSHFLSKQSQFPLAPRYAPLILPPPPSTTLPFCALLGHLLITKVSELCTNFLHTTTHTHTYGHENSRTHEKNQSRQTPLWSRPCAGKLGMKRLTVEPPPRKKSCGGASALVENTDTVRCCAHQPHWGSFGARHKPERFARSRRR